MKLKRLIIGCVALSVLAIVVAALYTANKQARGTAQVDTLSPRAEEFIAKDAGDGEGVWSTTHFEENKSILQAGETLQSACFSVRVPARLHDQTFEEQAARCTMRAKLLSPPVQVVVSRYPSARPSDDSGVVLRQKETDTYTSLPIKSAQFDQIWLFKGPDSMTAFAWKNKVMLTISLNGVIQPESLPDDFFQTIFESVRTASNSATMKAR